MQQIRGRIFFFHRQLTNRVAAAELFQITVVYLKFWAEVKEWCAGLHRWSFSFWRWKQGKLQASNSRLAVGWRGACIWTADSRAYSMSLLVKCIKTQAQSFLIVFFPLPLPVRKWAPSTWLFSFPAWWLSQWNVWSSSCKMRSPSTWQETVVKTYLQVG